MTSSEEQLRKLILQAIEKGQNGKIRACNKDLNAIYLILKKDPFLLWDDTAISQLGKAIIMMLHFDLIDDEEQNIGLAHLSYLFITRGIEKEENLAPEEDPAELFRLRKDRVILMKSCDDSFVDSLQEFYFADSKAKDLDEYNDQRKAVLSRLPYLIFADIHLIEQEYQNLRDDAYLLETANFIEYENEMSDENLQEGLLLHKILYKHTYQKLKNGELNY
ncbi:hypothetical protein GQR60_10010 [Labilibaculum sp. A4]|uniref:hypothetical protein n=1 Tax=Labilibaculum euxinus TaxID=2686357 RepID=UPI000F61A0AF|nr:hypothetical protein [Labilibaculum euxinus]MDQ1771436.1 hypothetical protein [Labilibaculum euxinus]MWN76676.1 hypothetical protein [Labilibaculum euxinus]